MRRALRGLRYHPRAWLAELVADELPYLGLKKVRQVYNALSKDNLSLAEHGFIGCNDRFYLLTRLLRRPDVNHPWLYDRCREVEAEPDGYLDLWARFHYKSTIITFGGTIQDIVCDPEIKIAIFSVTKPIAQAFLNQIKQEFEQNELLKAVYSDVLWERPRVDAPKWSIAGGIIVKRKGNPKEATLEGHGLVDGQPTSRHFDKHKYDDIVTRETVTNPEQIKKTTESWELADNLGSHEGVAKSMAGTRYHFADTYGVIMERLSLKPRVYPATDDGKLTGTPVFLTPERWEEIKRDQRSTVSAQMLLNPVAGQEQIFVIDWLRPYEIRPRTLNVYIMGDPSLGRTKNSDRTALAVIGIDANNNKYLLDGYCHRMPLSQRWRHLRDLYLKWSDMPGVQMCKVGYERYGAQSDSEYFIEKQREEGVSFEIHELNWVRERTGQSKTERISRMEPDFRDSRFYLPGLVYHPDFGNHEHVATWKVGKNAQGQTALLFAPFQTPSRSMRAVDATGQPYRKAEAIKRVEELGEGSDRSRSIYDLTRLFIEELLLVPFATHDDFSDATSRYFDMEPLTPMVIEEADLEAPIYADA